MGDQYLQDPLEYFHPDFLCQPLSESDEEIVESAKKAITETKPKTLSPDTHAKYQDQLMEVINTSPDKVATASYILEHMGENGFAATYLTFRNGCEVVKTLGRGPNKENEDETKKSSKKSEGVGRSTAFSKHVKAGGICQITGAEIDSLRSAHILPFSASKDNSKTEQYLELVKALFGPAALQRLLENVLNGDKNTTNNINRLDNGIAMGSNVHDDWDAMRFYLEVLWDTYNPSTKEFDVRFHWISKPQGNMNNYWNPPFTTPNGLTLLSPLTDNDIIPIRHRNSPPSTGTTTPSSASAPSFTSKRSRTSTPGPFLPSAYLLYIREILTHVARAMGAAGYAEYDYYDDDDDVSVLASDLEEEEVSKLSDPEQAEGKMSQQKMSQEEITQVAAWAEDTSGFINEHCNMTTQITSCIDEPGNMTTQDTGCIDEPGNMTTQDTGCIDEPGKKTILGKRRRSWTEGMSLALMEMLPKVSHTRTDWEEDSSDSDINSLTAMDRRCTIAI